jgi:hypothetical protein
MVTPRHIFSSSDDKPDRLDLIFGGLGALEA